MVLADSHGITRVPCYSGLGSGLLVFDYGSITLYAAAFQKLRLTNALLNAVPRPRQTEVHRFRLFPVRSPLLRESLLFSLPRATKMFQFARFPISHPITGDGLPHSDISGSKVASTSPERFAGRRVLHRLPVPRYPPFALCSLLLAFNLTSYYAVFKVLY
jgi:hypothetical protein